MGESNLSGLPGRLEIHTVAALGDCPQGIFREEVFFVLFFLCFSPRVSGQSFQHSVLNASTKHAVILFNYSPSFPIGGSHPLISLHVVFGACDGRLAAPTATPGPVLREQLVLFSADLSGDLQEYTSKPGLTQSHRGQAHVTEQPTR